MRRCPHSGQAPSLQKKTPLSRRLPVRHNGTVSSLPSYHKQSGKPRFHFFLNGSQKNLKNNVSGRELRPHSHRGTSMSGCVSKKETTLKFNRKATAVLACMVLFFSLKSFANSCNAAVSVNPQGTFQIASGGGSSMFLVNTGGTGAGTSCHWGVNSPGFISFSPAGGGGGGSVF
jgi:hypothetical protein